MQKKILMIDLQLFKGGTTVTNTSSYTPTPEEREYCAEQMRERLSRNMSDYYAQHPEAYALLKDLSEASESGGQTA